MKYLKFFENFTQTQVEDVESTESNPDEKKIYILIGPPAVGKSTWVKNNLGNQDLHVINRDEIVEEVAEENDLTYDDMFAKPGQDKNIGDKQEKYGEVIQSPSWMTWQPLSWSKISELNTEIQKRFDQKVSDSSGKSCVVVDMTNMSKKSRKGILDKVIAATGSEYKKIAVDFEFRGFEGVIKSAAKRRSEEYKSRGSSKTIGDDVIDRMISQYEPPTLDEGFDEIIVAPHY